MALLPLSSRIAPGLTFVLALLFLAPPIPAHPSHGEASPGRPLRPQSLGPFRLENPAGDSSRLSLGAQLRGTFRSRDLGLARDTEGELDFARLRLSLSGGFWDDRIRYKVQTNLSPASPELIDLVVSADLHPELVLSVGQTKIPFSAYRTQSFTGLLLADWGETSRWFGSERQIGATIGTPEDEHERSFGYTMGIFHGENSRASFSSRLARVYGEPVDNPSSFSASPGYGTPHPEFVARLRVPSESFDWSRNGVAEPVSPRWQAALSGTYDLRPVTSKDATARIAPELLVQVGRLGMHAIYYVAWVPLSEFAPAGGTTLGYHGPQVEVGYRFDRTWELSARHGLVHVTGQVIDDARARAQALLAGADGERRVLLSDQYDGVGDVDLQQEVSLGLNVYVFGDSLKWQTDVSYLPERSSLDGWSHHFRARSQAQIAF